MNTGLGRGLCGAILGAIVLSGCSDGDRGAMRTQTAPAVRAAGAGAGAGAAGSSDFGNGPPRAGSPAPMMQPPPKQTPAAAGGVLEPVTIDHCSAPNAAGLDAAAVQKLKAGGAPGNLRVLYPYDGTVFPRGLLAPTWMWDGGSGEAEAVYVHIKASKFEYHGCLEPTAPGQLTLPEEVWDTAGRQTQGPADPFVVSFSTLAGGAVSGPVQHELVIAQATIKGSIFYNSYSSALPAASGDPMQVPPVPGVPAIPGVPGLPGLGGSVLRIPPGGTAERFVSNECNGCHSVSVDGTRLLSQTIVTGGRSYPLAPDTPANPPAMGTGLRAAFGALYPDGSVYLATSTMIEVARSSLVSIGSDPAAKLYMTDTGAELASSGIPAGALMPMFSPDGTKLVFNDFAAAQAHGLAIMDYDATTHTATHYRVLFTDTDPLRPAWPFVLPDNGGVVFTRTDGADFSGNGAGIAGIPFGPVSDLFMADVKTGMVTILARAMGFDTPADAASNTTYLPFGADELHKNYFPTVSPVAAGGYFWVFFDAVRHYGNLGLQRQLWGAAIEIAADGNYAIDRSAPAFYLPGQEFGTGNHRAFAALDPCKKDGNSCTSGIDCCGGFCMVPEAVGEFDEPVGTCSSEIPMCAKTNERCTSSADCCPPMEGERMNSCIAGFCATLRAPD